jgi:hypothetical protein
VKTGGGGLARLVAFVKVDTVCINQVDDGLEDDFDSLKREVTQSISTVLYSWDYGSDTLLDLLERHKGAGCKDLRDRVYALLSLATDM